MFNRITSGRGLVLAGIVAGSAILSLSPAIAGGCPADKMKADVRAPDTKPAIIYIAEGEIVEYASNCSEPIVHKAGEIRPETSGTAHWWQNHGNKTVVLFVGDVLHDKNDKHM